MTERQQLERELAEARAHLAEDINALGDKLDVKAHARDAMADTKTRSIVGAVAIGTVAAVGFLLWRRRS